MYMYMWLCLFAGLRLFEQAVRWFLLGLRLVVEERPIELSCAYSLFYRTHCLVDYASSQSLHVHALRPWLSAVVNCWLCPRTQLPLPTLSKLTKENDMYMYMYESPAHKHLTISNTIQRRFVFQKQSLKA